MRMLGRFVVVIVAAFGGLLASQCPEFAQQYRQRLGGALAEMRQVVADFDTDARRNHLQRNEALQTYGRSEQPFLRDRGVTMTGVIRRYESLAEQSTRMDTAPPLMRPVVVLSAPDSRVVRGAWADFEPAIPVTPAGLIWAAVGFFAVGGFASLIRQSAGIARRRRRRPIPEPSGRPVLR